MKENRWIRRLAYVTGLVNQDLLLQNENLAADYRILRELAILRTGWLCRAAYEWDSTPRMVKISSRTGVVSKQAAEAFAATDTAT